MTRTARPSLWMLSALFTLNLGCGQIDLPVVFALQGDNTISLEIPAFPPGNNTFSSSLVGGAEATVTIDLNPFELFKPQGIVALIALDRVLIAGTDIDILGLHTGTLCIYDDVENPGGGIAYLRPLRQEADFNLTFNTLISVTDPFILSLFPDPLPFTAEISTTVPVTLAQLLGLLAGGGSGDGGLELSQELEAVLPEDIAILGGGVITADLTLATVEEFPSDPLIDDCEAFLAGL
jgi:hypothetical protein